MSNDFTLDNYSAGESAYRGRGDMFNNNIKPKVIEAVDSAPMGTTKGGPLPTSLLDSAISLINDAVLNYLFPIPKPSPGMMKCH
jgi:hypothetical protein